MGNIFISYRREDSQFITDRIFDHLIHHFSEKSLFKDVDNIPPGVDFRAHIDNAVKHSTVMLAIIGPGWLSARSAAGQRRLDDPTDPVCMELSSALRLQRPIVPVLVGGARMPSADELPTALKPLAYINAVPVRSDPDFKGDFKRLRRALEPIAGRRHNAWITPMAIAALALGAVIVWYAADPPLASLTSFLRGGPVPVPASPVPVPTPAGTVPVPAPTGPVVIPAAPGSAKDCVDVPFNDMTKIPPVTTTKRICG